MVQVLGFSGTTRYNEKSMSDSPSNVRPTKKQRELLSFIDDFISEHGYSPSYREIMNGLNYTSVATVALHVNSLIKRGHLRKRDNCARSLEVVNPDEKSKVTHNVVTENQEKWLIEKIEHIFQEVEQGLEVANELPRLQVLVESLQILGLEAAAQSFQPRLLALEKPPIVE